MTAEGSGAGGPILPTGATGPILPTGPVGPTGRTGPADPDAPASASSEPPELRLHRWTDGAVIGVAVAAFAAGFGQFGLVAALGDVARAKGMTEIAEATGLSRTSLYKALSQDGNPEFATVVKVLRSLGLRVGVQSAA